MKPNTYFYYFIKRNQKRCSSPVILISIFALILLLKLISSHFLNSSKNPYDSKSSVLPELPRLAYLLSGTKGDTGSLKRLLQAVYHPQNCYILHHDMEASDDERLELAKFAKSEAVICKSGNVMVIGKPYLITLKGPTAISLTLHAIAILLKQARHWDWFINLGASDYPLMPQDSLSSSISVT